MLPSPGPELPANYFALLSFVVVTGAGLTVWLIKRVIDRIVATQVELTKTLGNHFTEDKASLQEIAQHMAVTNQNLALITSKLLDAVIVPRGTKVDLKTEQDR